MNSDVELREIYSNYSYHNFVPKNQENESVIEFKENFFPFISRSFSELFNYLRGASTPQDGFFQRKIVHYTVNEFNNKIILGQKDLISQKNSYKKFAGEPEFISEMAKEIDALSKSLFGISKQIPEEHKEKFEFNYNLLGPDNMNLQEIDEVSEEIGEVSEKEKEVSEKEDFDFIVGSCQYYVKEGVKATSALKGVGFLQSNIESRLFEDEEQFYYLTNQLEISKEHFSCVAPSIDENSIDLAFYEDRLVLYAPILPTGFIIPAESVEEKKPIGFIAVFWYDEKPADAPGVVLPAEIANKVKEDLKNLAEGQNGPDIIRNLVINSGEIQFDWKS